MPDNNNDRDGEARSTQEEEEEANRLVDDFLKNPFGLTPQEQQDAEEDLKRYQAEQSENAKSTDWSAARRALWRAPSAEPDTSADPADQHEDAQEGEGNSQSQDEDQSKQTDAPGQTSQGTEASTHGVKPRRSARIAEQISSASK